MNNEILQPISNGNLAPSATASISSSVMMKLGKMFGPTDFVRVINIDSEPIVWQHLPESREEVSFDSSTSTVPMKNVRRGAPDIYKLEPGQSAILPGAVAYLMIENLVKQVQVRRTISGTPNQPANVARSFGFSDDMRQQELIDQIYLGREMPGSNVRVESKPDAEPEPVVDEVKPGLNDDLGLNKDDSNGDAQPDAEPEYQPIGGPKQPKRSKIVPR